MYNKLKAFIKTKKLNFSEHIEFIVCNLQPLHMAAYWWIVFLLMHAASKYKYVSVFSCPDIFLLLSFFLFFIWLIFTRAKSIFFSSINNNWELLKPKNWNLLRFDESVTSLAANLMSKVTFLSFLFYLGLFGFYFIQAKFESFFYYSNLSVSNPLVLFMKSLSMLIIFFIINYLKGQAIVHEFVPEVFIILFLGMFASICLVGSYNFILTLLSIEVLSLSVFCFFVVISFLHKEVEMETILGYYVVNTVATLFLVFGTVLIYGMCGSFDYQTIATNILAVCYDSVNNDMPELRYWCLYIGVLCFFLGIFIKIGIAPFHFWLLPIYQHFPIAVLSIVLIWYKTLLFWSIFTLVHFVFIFMDFSDFFTFFSIFTYVIAVVASISQMELKRLIIVLSLFSSGTLLFALISSTFESRIYFFLYLIVDGFLLLMFMLFISSFTCVNEKGELEYVSHLFSLTFIKSIPFKISLVLCLLCLSGFPPFSLFVIKFKIFQSYFTCLNDVVVIYTISLMSSINLFNYIRLIKLLLFIDTDLINSNSKFVEEVTSKNMLFNNNFWLLFFFNLTVIFNLFFILTDFLIPLLHVLIYR